jgi:hypothetical protein
MSRFNVHVFLPTRRGACVTVEADDESHAAVVAFQAVRPPHPGSRPAYVRNNGLSYWVDGVQMWVSKEPQ